MDTALRWIWGAAVGLVGLLGLFMAARGHDAMFQITGYLFMLFSIFFIFSLIHHYTGRHDGS